MVNTIDADKLSTQGHRASAAYALIYFSPNSQSEEQSWYIFMSFTYNVYANAFLCICSNSPAACFFIVLLRYLACIYIYIYVCNIYTYIYICVCVYMVLMIISPWRQLEPPFSKGVPVELADGWDNAV